MSNHVFSNAKTKVIIDIFWTQFFLFFSFQNSRQTCSSGQGGHLPCSVLCLMLKVEVFIVSVPGLEFKRREFTSYYNIACQIQKDLN